MFERIRQIFRQKENQPSDDHYQPEDILQGLSEAQIMALYETYIEDTLPLHGEDTDGARERD